MWKEKFSLFLQFTPLRRYKKESSSFTGAAQPDLASQLYDDFNELLGREIPVKTGVFAADMQVELVNDGPVTIVLDTKNRWENDKKNESGQNCSRLVLLSRIKL